MKTVGWERALFQSLRKLSGYISKLEKDLTSSVWPLCAILPLFTQMIGLSLLVRSIGFALSFLFVVNVACFLLFLPLPLFKTNIAMLEVLLLLLESYSLRWSRAVIWLKWLKLYTECIINLCPGCHVELMHGADTVSLHGSRRMLHDYFFFLENFNRLR